ncbi:MAG: hypothetical protein WA184_23525 [Stellaceae bacterium]
MNKFMTLAALAGALAGLPLAANATVTWSFYETSCSPISGGGSCRPYTSALASLTLPAPTSSGSASWTGSPLTPPVVGGDTDFTFTPEHGDSIAPPEYGFNSLCNMGTGSVDTVCSYDIGWSESAGILDGIDISYRTESSEFFNFGLTGGIVAADDTIGGCPVGGTCTVTGSWQSDLPVTAPEPMSALLLVTSLLGLGVVRPR